MPYAAMYELNLVNQYSSLDVLTLLFYDHATFRLLITN